MVWSFFVLFLRLLVKLEYCMNGLEIPVAKVQEMKDLAESVRRDIETRGMRVVLDLGQPAPSLEIGRAHV